MNPDPVLCPSRQSARGIVAQSDLHRLYSGANGALSSFQNRFLTLNDRDPRIGHAQNGIGHFDTDLSGANDSFQIGRTTCRIGIGGVRTQIHEAVGGHIQTVRQHIEGVFLHHCERPGVAIERHVVGLGRHDDQLFIVGQRGRFALCQAG